MGRWFAPLVVSVLLMAVQPAAAQDEPTLDPVELVTAAYAGLHGRQAGPTEVAYWADLIDNGVSPGRVIAEIGNSPEHRRHVVTALYAKILDRRPDRAGLDYWSAGLVDLLTADALAREMLASEEFYLRAGGTHRQFVAALYRTLFNRPPDSIGWWRAGGDSSRPSPPGSPRPPMGPLRTSSISTRNPTLRPTERLIGAPMCR